VLFLRRVLAIVATTAPLAGLFHLAAQGTGRSVSSNQEAPPYRVDAVLNLDRIRPKGCWYDANVPDTLDLADRAKFSINVLTRDVDPKQYYGVYQSFVFYSNPPKASELTWNITPKNARTLPMLRAMSGSDDHLEVENGIMRALLSQIAQDGNMYYPFDGAGPPMGTSYPQTNALTIFAMLNWHARDENPAWLDWIHLLAKGLRRDAIQVGDRAYYPLQSGIDLSGKWHYMLDERAAPIAYHPPDEPRLDQQGLEGSAKSDQARPLSALLRDYQLSGNKDSLETAQKLAREMLKPEWWADTSAEAFPGNEHGIFTYHFHGNLEALNALLDLGIARDNGWLKQFAREGYDHARRNGIVRMGWFPATVAPQRYNRPAWYGEVTEACGVADMITLAVKLTDAGLGDYWDDVDSIVRNQLATQQICSLKLLRKASGGSDQQLEEFLGGFGNGGVTSIPRQCTIAGCCNVNGAQGLYYAWHGITRFDNGVAQVNLFLNRASAWMDVDSYIPYEGKVVLHNKQAQRALVRIPGWVEANKVKTSVNGNALPPPFAGRYLVFDGLNPKDEIRLEFPVEEETDKYTIAGKQYTVKFRGSTLLEVTPRDTDPKEYPLYQRDELRGDRAPMHALRRFVADRTIPLGTY